MQFRGHSYDERLEKLHHWKKLLKVIRWCNNRMKRQMKRLSGKNKEFSRKLSPKNDNSRFCVFAIQPRQQGKKKMVNMRMVQKIVILYHYSMGSFTNYVYRFLAFFDSPTLVESILSRVDIFLAFLEPRTQSNCKRRLWMTPS